MISLVMERPSPVPLFTGFVVKKGSNILGSTSRGIPFPLSDIDILTKFSFYFLLICFQVLDDMNKSKGRREMSPDKKPRPLTKKERAQRKKDRKGRHKKL